MTDHSTSSIGSAWIVWGMGALFYLMGFFHRIAPAVMTSELMGSFGIDASALGNLSALYFYAYVGMQIPTGILADAWGPRRLLSAGALVAGCGALIFAAASNLFWAGVGRFLVGGSVAVAYVGTLKLATNWFPPHYYAMIAGVGLMAGITGAVFAGVPLRFLVDNFGWRPGMMLAAVVTLAVSILIWLIVRDDPGSANNGDRIKIDKDRPPHESGHPFVNLKEVLGYTNAWLLFFIPGGMVGAVLTFSGLWGVPFLTSHHGLSAAEAAALTTTLLTAWALASPVIGRLSDRIGRRKPLFVAGSLAAIVCWLLVIFRTDLAPILMVVLYIVTGIASASFITCFAHAKESVPEHLSGTVTGLVNMGVMLGPTVMQPVVGWMLDSQWQGSLKNGVPVYGLAAYQTGFVLMVAWIGIGLILLLISRETFCRQTE
jgi:MFS family permease